ncbi:MAG: GAF domain-containing protein [Anaerolineae bacterium]|nr:GAF domain-containing protein [Anaerolineae bacterium]
MDAQQLRTDQNIGAVIVVPLIYQENVLGTMTAINTQSQPDFSQDDVDLLTAMANQIGYRAPKHGAFAPNPQTRASTSNISRNLPSFSLNP